MSEQQAAGHVFDAGTIWQSVFEAACSGRRSPIQIQSVVSGIAGFDVHLTPGRGQVWTGNPRD